MKNSPTYNVLAVVPTAQVITVEVVVDTSKGLADLETEITDLIGSNMECEVHACEVVDYKQVTNEIQELVKICANRRFK